MTIKTCFSIPVLLCCLALGTKAVGQETMFPKGWYVRLGAGYSPVFNAPQFNAPINPLASLPRHNVSVPYEVQWQMKNRFGLIFQYRHVNITANIRADFTERMKGLFPYDYVTIDLPGVYDEFNHGEDAAQAFLALSYAMNTGKWSLQPRLMLGGTTYYPLPAEIVLKRRDSNHLSLLTLQPNDVDEESGAAASLTVGLGTLLQRHLWRRWSIFGIAEWTVFKPNLTYAYSVEDQVNGAIQTQNLTSDEWVQMLHLGGGLTFRITRKR